MNPENQNITSLHPENQERRILEYPALVDTVRLSVARLLDIDGSFKVRSFDEILDNRSNIDRESIINEVGSRFDDALIKFVIGTIIGQKNHKTIILAEESEGINGHFPWQTKLEDHVHTLKNNGLLQTVEVQVERYSSEYIPIENLVDFTSPDFEPENQQKHAA